MKYKIYFFFFACNMLLGSILGLSPAEKPIPYEDWKTAPYEYVAKEVVSAIIEDQKKNNSVFFNNQKQSITDCAQKLNTILCNVENRVKNYKGLLSPQSIKVLPEELLQTLSDSKRKKFDRLEQLSYKKLLEVYCADEDKFDPESLLNAQEKFINHMKGLKADKRTAYKALFAAYKRFFYYREQSTLEIFREQQEAFFHLEGEMLLKYQLINDISTGMELMNNSDILPPHEHASLPHIALARLVNCKEAEAYTLPYVFISSCLSTETQKQLRTAGLFQIGCTKDMGVFAYVKANIHPHHEQFYAHSERAIFEKLLELDKRLFESSTYILQVKNSLSMCQYCQDLWLNNSYKDKEGSYAFFSPPPTKAINLWKQLLFLSRIEVSRERRKITKKKELLYNLAINAISK